MRRSHRREFLKRGTAAVAGLAAGPWVAGVASGGTRGGGEIPPHAGLEVAGVHAYTDVTSVAAGQEIQFHVSSTVPYRLAVCRLGLSVDDPAGDTVLHRFPEAAPGVQAIHPGSYVHVGRGIRGVLTGLSVECWIRPWRVKGEAGIVTQWDAPGGCGFGLSLNGEGGVTWVCGTGGGRRPEREFAGGAGRLKRQVWHHVVGVWDGVEAALWMDGARVGRWPCPGPVSGGRAPLRIGAAGEAGKAVRFLDADVAMPAVYGRALEGEEIRRRFRRQGLERPGRRGLLACWPLEEERGDRVADGSGNGRHGTIVNHATWMIGGPSFLAEVARFGEYDPARDPRRGHGLRLASDDLYDCRWRATHRYRIPAEARPGLHVGRFEFELDGRRCGYHTTFVVRRGARSRPAPILVLCATNTWKAYSGTPFGRNLPQLNQVWGTGGIENSPGDPPANCFYRPHAAGQGTFQLGWRMPWPVASPYVLYGEQTAYSHLSRADRFFQIWLERAGYRFDVISDHDLHRDPDQLRRHRVFVINGHSEYWSLPMYRGLERYLAGGGNVICLSGNSLFWRVSYSEEGSILECRKVDAPGDQMPFERRGEAWHSHDGLRGGMLREAGYPGWRLIGLDTLGWNNQGDARQFGPFVVEAPEHFLFAGPDPVGVRAGEPIGQAAGGGLPRANGHEIDIRPSTFAALQEQPTPAWASLPVDPPGMVRLANGVIPWKLGGAAFDYFFRPIRPKTDQGGEMIYWERAEGGRVFNAGSIGAGWAIWGDPAFQRLMKNVLHHFGVKGEGRPG